MFNVYVLSAASLTHRPALESVHGDRCARCKIVVWIVAGEVISTIERFIGADDLLFAATELECGPCWGMACCVVWPMLGSALASVLYSLWVVSGTPGAGFVLAWLPRRLRRSLASRRWRSRVSSRCPSGKLLR